MQYFNHLDSRNHTETPTGIFDNIDLREKKKLSNRTKLFTAGIAIILMFVNTYLAHKATPSFSKYATDEAHKPSMEGAYGSIFVALPIAAFLLSLLTSLIPYKKLKYSAKYLQFSLIILVTLEIFLSVILCLAIPR